jgi:hypothetical protein
LVDGPADRLAIHIDDVAMVVGIVADWVIDVLIIAVFTTRLPVSYHSSR